jgi:hypothetical protein
MFRCVLLVALPLLSSACADGDSRGYVIRLDLDEIAARTADRDTSPGFVSLDR